MENMKHAKKLLGLLLVLAMFLSLAATAFATGDGAGAAQTETTNTDVAGSGNTGGGTQQTGTITIDNAVIGETYKIYQLLELESFDTASNAYSYKATSAWEEWLKTQTDYLEFDAQGYVTWVDGADPAAFAKAAQEKASTLDASGTQTATSKTVKFENVPLGYYLLDSSMGTLCSLDTTNPDVTIKEKNGQPTVTKQVKEKETFGAVNDANIGDVVEFQSVIAVADGAASYKFYDKMDAGLTFTQNGEYAPKVTWTDVNTSDVGRTQILGQGTDYTLTVSDPTGTTAGYTFMIAFTTELCAKLEKGDTLTITYHATLNENAVIGDGNKNDCWVTFGDNNTATAHAYTNTYTWSFEILKYANGNEETRLADAKFVLLNSDKKKVATIVNGKFTKWVEVPASAPANAAGWPENTVFTTNDTTNIEISGLDGGTYHLREVEAPAGYNLLAVDTEVTIAPTTSDNTMTLTNKVIAKVNNQSGTELPSTGGIGTTIFYVLGSALLIGAVVLLVARKRMNAEK